jgi:DNA-binding CsgD family transcriptional regulator/GAF domain-containing protein
MRRLTHRDFDRLSSVLLDLYQFRDHETFVAQTLEALRHLIPCERVTYNEMDMAQQTVYANSTLNDPRARQLSPVFTALMHQHPSIRHMQGDRSREREALRISDFLTDRQFKNLPLYREYYRHLDTTHQLAVNIDGSADLFISLAFNRHNRDFSDEEHVVLTLLRPHLALAHRNASHASHVMRKLSGLTTAVTAIGAAAVQVDQHGRISWMTDNAEKLLRAYCQTTSAEHLPPMIREWFRVQTAAWADHAAHLTASQPLTLHHCHGTLTASLLRDETQWWVLLQERREEENHRELEEAGLTARETEVLRWIAQGKTNGEAAIILGTKPATIKKHLERIYVKLRVETRTAAVASLNGFRIDT